jgi:UDP-N-acetylmuramoyl-L-alanyl-D-glutamate--2,6-diaminopimelate ligase
MAATQQPQHHVDLDAALAWLRARDAQRLCADSRRVQSGDAFIAWPGHGSDGRQYVASALKAGAAACLVEADGAEAFDFDGERVALLSDLKQHTGEIASRWLSEPSRALHVIAVTGTNGKTSVSWWTAQALSQLGMRCGVVGTLGVGDPGTGVQSTGLTTPDPVTLQSAFRRFADDGHQACAIEASSIGIVEHRLNGTNIEVAQFTNFTRDHLDYHGSMDAYWEAKAQLFDWPGLRSAVINVDDEQGARLEAKLNGRGELDLWTCSTRGGARLSASDITYTDGGLAFTVYEGATRAELRTRLIGDYNVSNLLAVIGALRALGVSLADAAAVCTELTPVPGRMQRVELGDAPNQPGVVVDYAHTPDALEKALQALRPFAAERGGRLWAVFGCGGNRDATKRPLMGAVAERFADQVVVTSDNPRNEAPSLILSQILRGMEQALHASVVEDRRAAIAHAVRKAAPNDVVLIAGKGHETEQEIAGVKYAFSDVQEARAALAAREVPNS